MSRTCSPLRYPGGKSCLKPLLSKIIKINDMQRFHYVEPYAGGCGLALTLLYSGFVSEIHINDVDSSIWSFWNSVLENTEELIELIQTTPVTMENWFIQKEIQEKADASKSIELGFATFFLNRTNRSGIIKKAGVIGGLNQNGDYKMDCRFNKPDLIRRIKRIKKYKSQITLTCEDAIDFMQKTSSLPKKSLFCIDPPYFNKGSSLYTSFYKPNDHKLVSEAILNLEFPWIVTYDNAEEIRQHYCSNPQYLFDINYSLQTKRVGNELLICSEKLKLPNSILKRDVNINNVKAA